MKTRLLICRLAILSLSFGLCSSAYAQFDELQNYGDGRTDGGGPGTFTSVGGVHSITAGGGDFWGGSDNASFLTASDGSLTTTADFTASVRHVGTSDPSTNDWGREPLMMRAQPATGAVLDPANPADTNAGSAHYMSYRRSSAGGGQMDAGWRETPGGGTTDWARNGGPGFISTGGRLDEVGAYMSLGRNGASLHAGWAADLSFGASSGTPGRWLALNSRDDHPTIGAGTEVTVGIGHQSHNGITGGGDGQNTATYDGFNYGNAFDANLFGAAPADDYAVGGGLAVDSNSGALTGRAYTFENGAATGEATGWKITARQLGATEPRFGVEHAVNDPTPVADFAAALIPAANFRHGGGAGLMADIYMAGNPGSLAGAEDIIANPADGSTVIPDIWWTHPGGGPPNGYPDAGGVAGTDDHGGANDTNLFAEAVQPGAGGPFEGGQDNYGVDMTGEIFVPGDAQRGGREWIAFKDGVDDYTYLEVDGVQLIDDNSWTGIESNQNQGGAISLLDTSDPKYDDGEWVSFRMIMWEGGGGDTAALYWDLDGTSTLNEANFPTDTPVLSEFTLQGTGQIGDDVADGGFGGSLPPGTWDEVSLMVANTGANFSETLNDVTVVPEPSSFVLAFGFLGMFLLRFRR